MRNHRNFYLKNLAFLSAALIVAFALLANPQIAVYIENAGTAGGHVSSFIVGAFYTSYVTSPAATAAIFFLGKAEHPLAIAFVGAFGAMLADYLLFRLIRSRASPSTTALARKIRHGSKKKIPAFIAPALAFIILASPLPDELGVAILGLTKVRTDKFLAISYAANLCGILAIALLGSL